MSRIKTENLIPVVQARIDKLAISIPELEKLSGLHNKTLYLLLKGEKQQIDRATLRALANALQMNYEIVGDQATLSEKEAVRVIGGSKSVEKSIEGVVQMLQKVDPEALDAIEDLVGIFAAMHASEVVELRDVCMNLMVGKNKQLFIEKLKAFAKILMPYEEMEKNAVREESKSQMMRADDDGHPLQGL